MKASILTIGDEILNGSTVDTNSAFIGKHSAVQGIAIEKVLSVSDTYQGIHEGLDMIKQGVEVVFITGGLGPTKDDITKKALADYFDSPLEFNTEVFALIEQFFKKSGAKIIERNRKLAMIPAKCELVKNDRGTAFGMWFDQEGTIFISMPGVPYEMKHMLLDQVLPRIIKEKGLDTIINKYIMTAGIGESALNEIISDIEDDLPQSISLSYLPSLGRVKLRLTAKNGNEELQNKTTHYQEQIAERLKKFVYSLNEEDSLEQIVGNLLIERKETISTAESCTGGSISARIISVPGSSKYYEGSIVSYSYDVKKVMLGVQSETLLTHGAVSQETVEEMLVGLLKQLNTTYGIAVSGIAGPGGGLPGKPVGTVWIAFGSKGKVLTRKYDLTPHRQSNIEITTTLALNQIRRFILGELDS